MDNYLREDVLKDVIKVLLPITQREDVRMFVMQLLSFTKTFQQTDV